MLYSSDDNSLVLLTKPNDSSEGTTNTGRNRNSSSPTVTTTTKKLYDLMFMDCCSFLGMGLGIDDDYQTSSCASIALIDSFDGGGSSTASTTTTTTNTTTTTTTFGDSTILGVTDSSTLVHDGSGFTLDAPPDNNKTKDNNNCNSFTKHQTIPKNEEEETKSINSTTHRTSSILAMNNLVKVERITHSNDDEEDEEESSSRRMVLLSEHRISEERTAAPEDEDESKTWNTSRSTTLRIPSSLDTSTLPPSLDTKTWDNMAQLTPVAGQLHLVETTVVGDTTKSDTTTKNYSNPSHSRSRSSLYDMERVPSLVVHACCVDDDDLSLVSAMSIEDEICLGNGSIGAATTTTSDSDRVCDDRVCTAEEPPIPKRLWKKGNETIPNAAGSWNNKTAATPLSAEQAIRSMVPVIQSIKSLDVTATTISTNEDDCSSSYYYGDNIPFDEPHSTCMLFPETTIVRSKRAIRIGQQ